MVRYHFTAHTGRITLLAVISGIVLAISVSIIVLSALHVLPPGQDVLLVPEYLIGVIAFVVLLPMLILIYEYRRAGVWIGDEGVRVYFPGEKRQEMSWSEARFAVNEGEDYLRASKGKEGLGHLFAGDRYVRLHLEGILLEQRQQALALLAEHVQVREPRLFTLMTLMNNNGDIQARGRLYLFEKELVCAENCGEKRVFFVAPLKDIGAVRQRGSFYIGRLECDAFMLRYKEREYVIMLGYETTMSGNVGTSSHWSCTGSAAEWMEELKAR